MPAKRRAGAPWSLEEFQALMDLLDEIRVIPKPVAVAKPPGLAGADLMRLSSIEPTKQDPTEHDTAPLLRRLEKSGLYIRLRKTQEFKLLQDKFRKVIARQQMKAGAHAEFEFLYWVLFSANWFFSACAVRDRQRLNLKAGKKPQQEGRDAYANARQDARQAIARLQALQSRGVNLDDCMDNEILFRLLKELDKKMSLPRKRRETAKTPAVDALTFFAKMTVYRPKDTTG